MNETRHPSGRGASQCSIESLERANARLRELSTHLVEAQERHWTRIASELHDGLGQMLTGVLMQLQAARRSDSPAQVQRCHDDAIDIAREAIRKVRAMSFQLRPAQLELLGFVAAVKAMLERQRESADLRSFVHVRGAPPLRATAAHAVALRILQEALDNARHDTGARRLVVRLRFEGDRHFAMTIGDDGSGAGASLPGLHAMLECVELLGGRLRLRSTRGRGTVVRLWL